MSKDEDISSLLELWDLEEKELNGEALISTYSVSSRGQRPNLLQNSPCVSEVPSGALDGKRTYSARKICATCACYNDRWAHWCTECGTAVIGPYTSSMKIPNRSSHLDSHVHLDSSSSAHSLNHYAVSGVSNNHSNHTHDMVNTFELRCRTTQLSTQQFTSKSNDLKTVSQKQGHSLSVNVSKRTASSEYSPDRCSDSPHTKRCWETSGVYMWRKPSSLGLSPCKFTIAKHAHGATESEFQSNSRDSVTFQGNMASTVSTKWFEI